MSTTKPAPLNRTHDEHRRGGPSSPGDRRTRSRVRPIALVVGAVVVAIGMALHLPAMAEDVGIAVAIAEAPSQWVASHLALSFGFVLVAVAAASALPLVRGRGAVLTTAGIVVTSLGAVVMALGDMAHGAVGFALVEPVDAATSFAVQSSYYQQPAAAVLNTGPLFLPLGMIVLAVGLLRSRTVPRWEAIVIGLTPIAVMAGFNLGLPTLVHGVPFLIGMTVLARVIARDPAGRAGAPALSR